MTALRFGLLLLAIFAVACAAANGDGEGGNSAPTSDLALSLQVNPGADSVRFTLQVTNSRTVAVPLEFSSGQRFDFLVLQGSREIWRWSADMMFTQVLRSESLAPGETRIYSAGWAPPGGTRGEFTAVGRLVARNRQVEQRAIFRLP